jgi:protein SCO1/2
MKKHFSRLGLALLLGLLLAQPFATARADHDEPGPAGAPVDVEKIDFEQKTGAALPLNLSFRDERGQPVRLAEFFNRSQPVILHFAYFDCPMLCSIALNDLTRALKDLSMQPGRHFQVLTVSIDPKDTPEKAAAKKATYIQEYDRAGAETGWHFLTGSQEAVAALAEAAGFKYVYDETRDEFAHPAGLVLATPRGVISAYLLGIGYAPRDLRLGLVEAAQAKLGTAFDRIALLCYAYDPASGRYTLAVQRVFRLGGAATVAGIGVLIAALLVQDRRRKARQAAE